MLAPDEPKLACNCRNTSPRTASGPKEAGLGASGLGARRSLRAPTGSCNARHHPKSLVGSAIGRRDPGRIRLNGGFVKFPVEIQQLIRTQKDFLAVREDDGAIRLGDGAIR